MADNLDQEIIVTAKSEPSSATVVQSQPRYQNIEDFRDNADKARVDIQSDMERTKKTISDGIHSRSGMAIDEIAERAEGLFARTSERIDKIDGVADGVLRVPGMEEPLEINEVFADFVGPQARENIASTLSEQMDIDKNGRISRTETEIAESAARPTQQPAAQSDLNSGGNLLSSANFNPLGGMLAGFQPPLGMKHDVGAPPHDPATSAPPAVQNDNPVQTQVEGVGVR